jgi:hypothetical protein
VVTQERRDLTGVLDTDGHLRLAIQRAAQAVGQDVPEAAAMLGVHLAGTLGGQLSDGERAARYRELGGLLSKLGEAYEVQATQLRPPGQCGVTTGKPT